MRTPLEYTINAHNCVEQPQCSFGTDLESIEAARIFHRSLPGYSPTPLYSMRGLAGKLGVRRILLKDESKRFGLNAFKALGASFAVSGVAAGKLTRTSACASLPDLGELRVRLSSEGIGPITFVTATDGNHGRAVAWSARMLGSRAVVFMPKGAARSRVEAIRSEGAEVIVTESNYDDAVRTASAYAVSSGGMIVQDTSWEGYTEIPDMIMQGYLTMLSEIAEQLSEMEEDMPSHVVLQAGVGSFAGSMLAGLEYLCPGRMPKAVIVEPVNAACYFLSASRHEAGMARVNGELSTIMAGLACGEPNPRAWHVIMRLATAFTAVRDSVAEEGMRMLAHPSGDDPAVVSGESGAVGVGLLSHIMVDYELRDLKEALRLGRESKVLLISTEGDTDPEGYKRVIDVQ